MKERLVSYKPSYMQDVHYGLNHFVTEGEVSFYNEKDDMWVTKFHCSDEVMLQLVDAWKFYTFAGGIFLADIA